MVWDDLNRTERNNEVSLKVLGVNIATRSYSDSRDLMWDILSRMMADGWGWELNMDHTGVATVEFTRELPPDPETGARVIKVIYERTPPAPADADTNAADTICRMAVQAVDAWDLWQGQNP